MKELFLAAPMVAIILVFGWIEVSRHKAIVEIARLAAEKGDEEEAMEKEE